MPDADEKLLRVESTNGSLLEFRIHTATGLLTVAMPDAGPVVLGAEEALAMLDKVTMHVAAGWRRSVEYELALAARRDGRMT